MRRSSTTISHQQETLFADVETAVEAAEDMPDEYLECRDMGHQWAKHGGRVYTTHIDKTLRCPRCHTMRVFVLTPLGGIVSSHYDYSEAPNYLMPKGTGRIGGDAKDALRLVATYRELGVRKKIPIKAYGDHLDNVRSIGDTA